MTTIDIEIDAAIFNAVYLPYLDATQRTQIFYGGSSSGKSVFLAQRTIYDLLRGGRNYLICRAVSRTIRRSVFNELKKIISDWGVSHLFDINKSDGIITCVNGYQILFSGLDDTEKIKSITPERGVITDIWIEEATETDRDSVRQLYKRQRGGRADTPKRLTLSFNPIVQTHWIYQDFFTNVAWADDQTEYTTDTLSILKTWYIHNAHLTPDDIADLENETDSYFSSVYTYGNWGVLGDVIFTNWRVEDLSGMRGQFVNHRNGLDFGFSNDPATVVMSHYDRARKRIYIYDELYERGLTNADLADLAEPMLDGQIVKADSAEPKSIAELKRRGLKVYGAKKGPDSVLFGIQWLQQHEIIIDKSCINTRTEFQLYQWKKDRDGNSMKQPIDKHNHIIDPLRYAYEDDMVEYKKPRAIKYA